MKLTGLVVVAAATALLAAAPAGAANLGSEGGLTYVKGTAKVKGSPFGTATPAAQCPKHTVPVGGGEAISGSPKTSFIGGFYPLVGERWGAELWNYEAQKKATATAWGVCTKDTGKVTYANGSTLTGTPGFHLTQTSCDDGSITGGGYSVPEQTEWYTNAIVFNVYPGGDPGATNASQLGLWHLTDSDDTITRYAVCMTGGKPKFAMDKTKGRDPLTAKVYCPKGTSVTSGGFYVVDDTQGDSSASVSKPIDSKKDADKVPDDGWQAVVSDPESKKIEAAAVAACR